MSIEVQAAPAVMTPDQCAALLNVSKEQLSIWRTKGGGPRWSKPSDRIIRYLGADVVSWLEECRA